MVKGDENLAKRKRRGGGDDLQNLPYMGPNAYSRGGDEKT